MEYLSSELDLALTEVRDDNNVIAIYFNNDKLKLNLAQTKILIISSPIDISAIDSNALRVISVSETITEYNIVCKLCL